HQAADHDRDVVGADLLERGGQSSAVRDVAGHAEADADDIGIFGGGGVGELGGGVVVADVDDLGAEVTQASAEGAQSLVVDVGAQHPEDGSDGHGSILTSRSRVVTTAAPNRFRGGRRGIRGL